MKTIQLIGDSIEIQLTGWDVIWALKKSLTIPISEIVDVYQRPKGMRPPWLRIPGTYVPGLIAAGTYLGKGRKEFWSSYFKADSIVIDCRDSKYTRIALDPIDASDCMEALKNRISKNPSAASNS